MHPLRSLFLTLALALIAASAVSPAAAADSAYAEVRELYSTAGDSWAAAWAASEVPVIRQHLEASRAAYADCLAAANATSDPANAANLALIRSIAAAYVDLADAALAMYDGADAYTTGRGQMDRGEYAAAASTFEDAASEFESSQALFGRASAALRSVSFVGTEYGDGSAYIAAIVPILDAKAAYVGEFAAYARGWQHAALAYAALAVGDRATAVSEARLAIDLFDGLRSSPSFGADAAANRDVLAGLLAGNTPTGTPTPTASPTPSVTTTPGPAVTVQLRAEGSAFTPDTVAVPAGARVTLVFTNADPGTTHSVSIFADPELTSPLFEWDPVPGDTTETYTFVAPARPGRYPIACGVPRPHRMATLIVE